MATDNTGTANSPYNAVSIETISGEIQAAPLNTSLGNLDTAVESHTHPLDSNVGFDSMKSSFRPVDTGDSTNRWRLVSGRVSITPTYGDAGKGSLALFVSGMDQGDPGFSTAAESVRAWATGASADMSYEKFLVTAYAVPTAGIQIFIYPVAATFSGGRTFEIDFIAYGKVA